MNEFKSVRHLRFRGLPVFAALVVGTLAVAASPGCFPKLPPEEVVDVVDDTAITPPGDVQEGETALDVLPDVAADGIEDTTPEIIEPLDTSEEVDTGPTLNACGGTMPITMDPPGNSCGVCDDGVVICDPADSTKTRTRCIDASALNSCGGCGVVEPTVGTACGDCGLIACAEAGTSATTCVEPAGGCETALTCADLTCEAQGRVCAPGVDEEDAACGACAVGYLEFGEVCLISLGAPTGVTATTNRDADVRITWTAVTGAGGYKVYRCPVTANCTSAANWTKLTGANAITVTTFDDTTTASGGIPTAPQDIEGTTDRLDDVTVTWTAVEAPATPFYKFAVTTMSPAGESSRSGEALGSRAVQPITGYQIEVDGAGIWTDVGSAATWTDSAAPAGVITAGTVTATTGLFADRVDVALTGASSDPGTQRRYRVRALSAAGQGLPSVEAAGRRAVGSIAIAWEKSTGLTATTYAPVTGVTTTAWSDTNAPANGEMRWYRARVTASGAVEAVSAAVSGSRQSAPDAVTGLVATTDRVDEVRLTWTAAPGALGYHVYRDGTKLTTGNVGISSTSYEDRDALTAPATEWAAPSAAVASSDDPDKVTISWTAPVRPLGSNFSYTVRPVNAAGEGVASSAATGRRVGAALTGFEVKRAGGAWVAAGGVAATQWIDTTAPAPTVAAGTVTASDATDPAKVLLAASSVSATNGALVSYALRATTASGPGAETGDLSGRRQVGPLVLQWQRSAGASADTFSDLVGATTTNYSDTTAPSSGEVRYYRISASAAGATTVFSAPDAGSRLPPAGVPGNVQATTDRTGEIRVTWGSVAGATGYKVYRGGVLISGAAALTAATYDDNSATTAVTSSWAAPTALAATNGPNSVVLSWTAPTRPLGDTFAYTVTAINAAGESAPSASASGRRVAPALAGYEVSIDNGVWAATGNTTTAWTDSAAPAGTLTIGAVTASDETYAEYVRITAAASATNGALRSYRVRAVLADTANTPASTSVDGGRVVGTVGYQWERSSGTTNSGFTTVNGFNSSSHDDSGAPANGDIRWYRVRVSAPGVSEALSTAVSGRRLRPPETPLNITATTQLTTGIDLSWDPAARASGYHVFRGAVQMTTQPVTGTTWTDSSAATAPDAWAAPTNLVATGSFTDIGLSWTAPTRPTRSFAYSVRAVNASGQSDLSSAVTGTRVAVALDGYDIERTPSGGQSAIISATSTTATWTDANATGATITAGTATASEGTYREHVLLTLTGAGVTAGPLYGYRVRARLSTGSPTGWSNSQSARRANAASVSIQWQVSLTDDPLSTYSDISGGTTAAYTAGGGSALLSTGVKRWYRARISASGATNQYTVSKSGWRYAVVDVSVGESHSCALDSLGAVRCWGNNYFGQLGLGHTNTPILVPTIVPGLTNIKVLRVGSQSNQTCAIDQAGSLYCWGQNAEGLIPTQISIASFKTPQSVDLGTSVLDIALVGLSRCALLTSGNVVCWGKNTYGGLGRGPVGNGLFTDFGAVRTGSSTTLQNASAIGVGGGETTCVSTPTGPFCWGAAADGDGMASPVKSEYAIPFLNFDSAFRLPLGNPVFGCIRKDNASLACWGDNNEGQLGMGGITDPQYLPVPVSIMTANFRLFAIVKESMCIATSQGEVWCWGNNAQGELGNGNAPVGVVKSIDLVKVVGLNKGVNVLSGGWAGFCAITGGELYCWGLNTGNGTGDGEDVPVLLVF